MMGVTEGVGKKEGVPEGEGVVEGVVEAEQLGPRAQESVMALPLKAQPLPLGQQVELPPHSQATALQPVKLRHRARHAAIEPTQALPGISPSPKSTPV